MILQDKVSRLEKTKLLEIITDREMQIDGKRIQRGQRFIKMAIYLGTLALTVLSGLYSLAILLIGIDFLFSLLTIWNIAIFILLILLLMCGLFVKKLNETQPIILNIFKYRLVQPIEWDKDFYPNVNKVIVFSDILMIYYAKEGKNIIFLR